MRVSFNNLFALNRIPDCVNKSLFGSDTFPAPSRFVIDLHNGVRRYERVGYIATFAMWFDGVCPISQEFYSLNAKVRTRMMNRKVVAMISPQCEMEVLVGLRFSRIHCLRVPGFHSASIMETQLHDIESLSKTTRWQGTQLL